VTLPYAGTVSSGPAFSVQNFDSDGIRHAAITGQAQIGPGIVGTSTTDSGIYGSSMHSSGVYGRSDQFHGVAGHSDTGFGLVGEGGRAPLWLVPSSSQGPPAPGQKGALYVDLAGTLYYFNGSSWNAVQLQGGSSGSTRFESGNVYCDGNTPGWNANNCLWRLTFATPFNAPPTITVGLTHLDGNRMDIRAQNVTTTGFEIYAQTFNNGSFGGVGASWFAYGN
jgi:hypothetical protein